MQIALFGKFLCLAAGGSAVAAGGTFFFSPDLFGVDTSEPFEVYGITSDSTSGSPTLASAAIQLSPDTSKRNYQCKLTGLDDKQVDCELEFFNLDTTKKITSQATWKQQASPAQKPDKDKLKTQYKPIKVTIKGVTSDWEKLGKKIDILSKTQPSQIYGSFTPLFATHGDEILGKSEYFLGLTKTDSFTFAASDTYQCSFKPEKTPKHNCEVLKLNTSSQGKTTKPEALTSDGKLAKQESAITKAEWFVVKITDSNFDKKLLDHDQDIAIHVTKTPPGSPSPEVILIDSSSVFVADTAATDQKHIFLTQ